MEEVTEVFERARVYVSAFKFVKKKSQDLEKFKSEIKEVPPTLWSFWMIYLNFEHLFNSVLVATIL